MDYKNVERFYLWVEGIGGFHQTGQTDGYGSLRELEEANKYYFDPEREGYKKQRRVTHSTIVECD